MVLAEIEGGRIVGRKIFQNCNTVEVIDNSYESMEKYGFYLGYSEYELTKEQVQQLLDGKIIAVNDGEYSSFFRLKESED